MSVRQHILEHSKLGLDYDPVPKGLGSFFADTFNGINFFTEGFEKTPNVFFDPNASSSLGYGTYRQPFNSQAQIEAYFTSIGGNFAGKVLGVKRGSRFQTVADFLSLNLSGTTSSPAYIVPYGDALALPLFDAASRKTDWVIHDQTDPSNIIWKRTVISGGVPIWRGSVYASTRMEYITYDASLTNLKAKGRGWMTHNTTTIYFIPVGNENPNDAEYYTSDSATALGIVVKDIANKGGLIVCGMHAARGYGISLLFEDEGATGSSSNALIGCPMTDNGGPGVSGTGNGLTMKGINQANPMLNSRVVANYGTRTEHNVMEFSHCTGFTVESNVGYDNGDFLVELWSNCNNFTIRYNRSDAPASHPYYGVVGTRNNGIVVEGKDDAGVANGTTSVGNVAYGNLIIRTAISGLMVRRGEMDFYNNTVIATSTTGGTVATCGEAGDTDFGAGDTVKCKGKFVNNLVVSHWGGAASSQCTLLYVSDLGVAGYNNGGITGPNAWANQNNTPQFGRWNDASQASLAAFNTASTNKESSSFHAGAGAPWTTFAGSIDTTTWKPLSGNIALASGTVTGLPAGMTRDVYGKPFPAATPNCGAVQT